MQRYLKWPELLFDFLERSESSGFSEDYYCATFAADAVDAMTGVDVMKDWRGLTQAQAEAAVVAQYGSIRNYLEQLFGEPIPAAFARRGDVVIRADGTALGICVGALSAFLSDEGLAHEPTLECVRAYRV